MTNQSSIPKAAMVAIDDLMDSCGVAPGKRVLLVADIQGLFAGDSAVDADAIGWLEIAACSRGADVSVLWMDEKFHPEGWQVPPALKAAMLGADIVINHSFNISPTDLGAMRYFLEFSKFRKGFRHVRNFASTGPLLCSQWAQTPYELLMEIRYQAALRLKPGLPFLLTDPNGTHLQGVIAPPPNPADSDTPYAERRRGNMYQFWPEWLHKPVHIVEVNGSFIYDCMSPFWSRYVGVSPYFNDPVELQIENCRITKISGGIEADALQVFLQSIARRFGEDPYNVNVFHTGIHPQAVISPQQCPSPLIRRQMDHSHSRNVHIHIGAPSPSPPYDYYLQHCTADIRNPTFLIGDYLLHEKGHLTVLDSPEVQAVVQKYPDRPGTIPVPRNF